MTDKTPPERETPRPTPDITDDVEQAARQRGRLPINDGASTDEGAERPSATRDKLKKAADLNDATAAHKAHGEGGMGDGAVE